MSDNILDKLNININILDEKKQQTEYKIRYVSEYVNRWLYVITNLDYVDNINFIDCMCNAGIYTDGAYCTSVEVLLQFIQLANKHTEKTFNLFLNDINIKRLDVLRKLKKYLLPQKINNLNVYISNDDVNSYLSRLTQGDKYFKKRCSTILYVDPYNLGTVDIDKIKTFINKYYCELIYNFFTSDFIRNKAIVKIPNLTEAKYLDSIEDLVRLVREQLKIGHMKYLFSYKFKTMNNTEIYQIIFVTPSKRGLEVLKDTLWEVFDGKFYHRNTRDTHEETSYEQESFFSVEQKKNAIKEKRIEQLQIASEEARFLFLREFKYCSKEITFDEIELFIIEKTMLRKEHIKKYIIEPLIGNRLMVKLGKVERKNNFSKDSYKIVGENNE